MRQRGAGTRDIVLAFDLDLPGLPPVSKTPLKPQKSNRSRKDPVPELQPLRSTRKTPKSITTKAVSQPKPTPTTARRKRPKATVEEVPADDVAIPGKLQQDDEGLISRKRKRKATEDVVELQSTAPLKKQRKGRSMEQETLKMKSRPYSAPSDTTKMRKATTRSRQVRRMEDDATEEPAGPQVDAIENPLISNVVQEVSNEEKEKASVPEKPRKRKRKSIGQSQRRKAKPIATLPVIPLDKADLVEERQAPTKVEEPVERVAVETRTKMKPRRKRKAIAQSPKKRNKISLPKKSQPGLGNVPERQTSLPNGPGADLSLATAIIEEKPIKRRGRSKPIVQASPNTPEVAVETTFKAPEPNGVQAESSLAEAQDQKGSDLAPKRRGRKRKSIGQVQTPRKKRNINPSMEFLALDNTEPKVDLIIEAPEATVAPEPKRKSRTRKPPVPTTAITDDRQEAEHENIPSLQVPKKRGRPKKATASADVALPVAVEASEHVSIQQADVEEPPPKVRRRKCPVPTTTIEHVLFAQDPGNLVSGPNPQPQPVPNVKKRGRPKKQDCIASITELHERTSKSLSQVKSGRSTARPKSSSLAEIHEPPTSAIPQKPTKAICTMTRIGNDEDDEDPLSDLAPLHPRTKPTKKHTSVPKPQRNHLRTESKVGSTASINADKTRPPDFQPQIIPISKQSSLAEQNPPEDSKNNLTPHPDALDTHIHASRQEEKALRADLQELHAQQARELAEQKQRDLAARLESLSASVKKRKMEARSNSNLNMKAIRPIENGLGDGQRGRERTVSKGLENFVFRTVGKSKRTVGGGDGVDDIDPELQALLSRVKGVNAGGVVGVF